MGIRLDQIGILQARLAKSVEELSCPNCHNREDAAETPCQCCNGEGRNVETIALLKTLTGMAHYIDLDHLTIEDVAIR